MRIRLVALLTALMACTFGAQLQAANLIVNGDFENVTMTNGNAQHSTIFGNGAGDGLPTLQGWSTVTGGYNFIYMDNPNYHPFGDPNPPKTATGADDYYDGAYTSGDVNGGSDSPGNRFSLWGPDTPGGSENGITNSPVGGNFLAADGSYLNRPIEQTLSGLVVGQTYYLSFWWAASQQAGLYGDTKEGWVVCLGTCEYHVPDVTEGLAFYNADPGNTDPSDPRANELGYDASDTSQIFKTSVVTNGEGAFTPWKFETFVFTATADTQKISLLAYGTPAGQPPVSLMDGLSIDINAPVPEPSTWAMMLIGFGVIGGVMRTRRNSTTGRGAFSAQII